MNLDDLQQRWPLPSAPRPIVLVGAGGIVNDAHLPAYRAAGLPVLGTWDPDRARREATAERWNLERAFASLAEATGVKEAVFDVAVPPGAVLEVVRALPEGSAVLIQKPLGLDLADATRIRDACRARGLTAAVNFQLRFAPNALALTDALKRGLFGTLTELEVLVNVHTPWQLWPFMRTLEHMELAMHTIHYLDFLRGLAGDPSGVWAKTLRHPEAPQLTSSRSSVILDYGDDLRCALSVNHHHRFGQRHQASRLRLEGTSGAAVMVMGVNLDYPRGRPDRLEITRGGDAWEEVPLSGSWFPDAFGGPMSNLQRFAAGEDRVLVTAVDDAWRTMALVEACYRSSAAGATPIPEPGGDEP